MRERPANELIHATSPYLLQHAHNPVRWRPWGPEALALARDQGKPIFLSIGYSACHWCHVMERESFEDEEVAELLNGHFVPIKVDREERPDLDEIYMEAVQALTGRGGWPMSVWLTPDLKPFYGGTYFPPDGRYGLPGFRQVLEGIRRAWADQRPELEADAARLTEFLAREDQPKPADDLPDDSVFAAALEQLRRNHDPRWGGFGPAPKFPPVLALDLVFRRGSAADLAMAERTLDAMAAGGLFDHLGGGFARYSVDERWLVPHFEKMLYDNAQLAACYLDAFQISGKAAYREVAQATLDYLLRDLRDPQGGFHSSEDADSEGQEGRFYVFTPDQVRAALGAADGDRFCRAYGITETGSFEHGTSVLHRFEAPPGLAMDGMDQLRARLRAFRDGRVRPGKDDKVVACWNGLALTALARAHQVLGGTAWLAAAEALARFLSAEIVREGVLLRTWRRGQAGAPGFLEDYGAVAAGLVDLYEAGFDPSWLRLAETLAETMLERFEAAEGGFCTSPRSRPDLLVVRKPWYDGVIPSGNTLAVRALVRLAGHLDRADFRASAKRTLRWAAPRLAEAPGACQGMLGALDLAGASTEIVIAGPPADPATQALLAAARRPYLPRRLVTLAAADPDLPLHQGRLGAPAAYVCRNRVCAAPVSDPAALETLLEQESNRSS